MNAAKKSGANMLLILQVFASWIDITEPKNCKQQPLHSRFQIKYHSFPFILFVCNETSIFALALNISSFVSYISIFGGLSRFQCICVKYCTNHKMHHKDMQILVSWKMFNLFTVLSRCADFLLFAKYMCIFFFSNYSKWASDRFVSRSPIFWQNQQLIWFVVSYFLP